MKIVYLMIRFPSIGLMVLFLSWATCLSGQEEVKDNVRSGIYYSEVDSIVDLYARGWVNTDLDVHERFLVSKYSYVIASQFDQGGPRDYIHIVIMEKDGEGRYSAELVFVPDSAVLCSPGFINDNHKALRAEFHISKLPVILDMLEGTKPVLCYIQIYENGKVASLSIRNEVVRKD